jgi:D-glycero-D-manno-heptose 1,7-bisphosphate phosphatase
LPGAGEAIRILNEKNIKVMLVSNQPGIAKKLFSVDDLCAMTAEIEKQIIPGKIDAVFFCPHGKPGPDDPGCECRKPKPGMLLAAMRMYDAAPAETYMFGDSESDIVAAKKADVHPVYIATKHDEYDGNKKNISKKHPDIFRQFRFGDLSTAATSLF